MARKTLKLFAALFLLGGAALAVEYAPASQARSWGPFLSELMRSLDVFGFLLLAILVVAVGMAIDSLYHLRIQRLIPEQLLLDVQAEISDGEYEKAVEVCSRYDCMASQIFAAGLSKVDHSYERMYSAMRTEAEIIALVWRQWIGQFRTIAIVSPLIGMVAALANLLRIVSELPGRPNLTLAFSSSAELRELLYSLLLGLLLGLATAIIARIAYGICKNRLDRITLECLRLGDEVLDPFRPLPQYMEEQ